ncbi:hypothetical protein Tco_0497926 [Tanacetum coccineum]
MSITGTNPNKGDNEDALITLKWLKNGKELKYSSLALEDLSLDRLETKLMQKGKVDTGKAMDTGLVVTESSGTKFKKHDTSSRSRNDTNADDEYIRPYMTKSQWMRWKPTSRIFKTVGLRWVPTGKIFASCTSKVDGEPPHGFNVDISKIRECKQILDLSAGTSINVQKEQSFDLSAGNVIVMTSMIELESLFGHLFDEYFNGENQVVSKSSTVTTADASDKRQQQPDLTSSTSTLATTVTADGNFDVNNLEPALNLTVQCCGSEFRFLNGMIRIIEMNTECLISCDQASFEQRGGA